MVRLCYSLLLFWLSLPAYSQDASQISEEECFLQKNFNLNLFLKGTSVSVGKESCNGKVVLFNSPGSRWSIDFCNPKIRIGTQSPVDAPIEYLYAGSARCPAPLFAIDLDSGTNNMAKSDAKINELLLLMKDIRQANTKDNSLGSVGGQVSCFERVLQRYYNKCQSFTTP